MSKHRLSFLVVFLFCLSLSSFTKNNTELPPKDKFVVVLDAGHGGHDPGNIGNGYLEKDIALQIVLKVGKQLEKDPSIKVLYTRDDDTFVNLFERGKIANEAKADLFVSVHCNAHSSNAFGTETYVLGLNGNNKNFEVAKKENSVIYLEEDYEQRYEQYDINSPESVIGLTIMQEEFLEQSVRLAGLIQGNFSKKLSRKDRKVKQNIFIVLHQTFMPSVLVEAGFLTNKDEGKYLNSTKGQTEMSKAIADAILEYKKELSISITSDVSVENAPKKQEEKIIVPQKKEPVEVVEVKKEEIKPETKPVETPPVTTPSDEIVFKVQLMASSKNIPLKKENFRGLDILSTEPVKNLYRYMYGNAKTYDEAKKLKTEADAKGYTTSYIVAYKKGVRIQLKEAIK